MNSKLIVSSAGAAAFAVLTIFSAPTAHSSPGIAGGGLDRVVDITFSKASESNVHLSQRYECDSRHPYLVLDSSTNNTSQFFRHATFRTGDNEPLHFQEHIIPIQRHGFFTAADMFVQIEDSNAFNGHGKITIQCASTLVDAHQR
ncbi:hypothetical protein LQL77_31000 [Rhodococcus cerastii]|nr:hypothetical protein [Rhodococcus cerastii]